MYSYYDHCIFAYIAARAVCILIRTILSLFVLLLGVYIFLLESSLGLSALCIFRPLQYLLSKMMAVV